MERVVQSLNYSLTSERIFCTCLVFSLLLVMVFFPCTSFAAGEDGISCTLYKVTSQLTGPIGQGISIIAVVVLGIGLFLGKLSWGLAIATAVGIGIIFQAPKMVSWLSGVGNIALTC
ncbi:TrbC/VirB2 family type IV secretion system protein [Rickettsia endosymbiont of Cardiosporidium cionae]|uniref:TrbC/VirB2 family protein n=1 Tax=Rickettsia endosymbiont of Cardiosporidium cionae TaxID=2777155 RepID=UPI001893EC20|nr:TrbC/VirB2 family protein [Rickettsia endosymbiont of Cardiosporidium cionae]KAF8817988.1 hypothetical protein IHI24_000941 [Rickettsia endosymbiont of Cardiosporidium cionae]